jgi:hypothetical protein
VLAGGGTNSVTITGDFSPGLVLAGDGSVSVVEVQGLDSWLNPNGWTPSVYPDTTTFSAYGLSTITSFVVDGYELFASVDSVSNSLYTLNLIGFVHGDEFPALGSVDVVVEDDDATTLAYTTTLYTLSGYSTVTIADPINDGEGTIASAFPVEDPLQEGEVIHYPNGDGQSIATDSSVADWPPGTYELWVRRYDNTMFNFDLTIEDEISPPSTPPNIDKRFIMEFLSANAKALTPLGYQQITDLSAAVALTVPLGTVYVIFKPNTQAIRYRDDGTDPTASVGYPVAAGAEYIYTGACPTALKLIQTTASATLDVLYYGV